MSFSRKLLESNFAAAAAARTFPTPSRSREAIRLDDRRRVLSHHFLLNPGTRGVRDEYGLPR